MKRAIIVVTLILIAFAISAEAQRRIRNVPRVPRIERNRNPIRLNGFDRLDLNRDGYISLFEWRGNRRKFDQLDFNNDGRISRSEWRFRRRR